MLRLNRSMLFVVCGISCWLSGIGCASAPQEIPTGEWRGTGDFLQHWGRGGSLTQPAGPPREALTREYKTRLAIEKKELKGQKMYIIKILSHCGEMPELEGGLTFLRLAMVPTGEAGERWRLLALHDATSELERNLWDEDWELRDEKRMKPVPLPQIKAYRSHNGFLLHVCYTMPGKSGFWQDVFIFRHDKVCKMGSYMNIPERKDGSAPHEIAWVENLKRVK